MVRGCLQHSKWYIRVVVWLGIMAMLTVPMLGFWFVATHDPQGVRAAKWLQFWQTLTVFILPALLAVYLWSERPREWLHLDRGITWGTALKAMGMMVLAIPAINLMSWLNQQLVLPASLSGLEAWMKQMEDAAQVMTERFMQVDTVQGLLINIGLMAVLPAIGEELSFRGVVQGLLTPRYKKAAIWLAACIFSFIHFQFYGFVPRMLMGALFGYMLVWTGNLWVPIVMHMTNNAVAVLAYYVANRYAIDGGWMEEFGAGSTWYVGVLSLAVVITMACFVARERS